jgi:hypothetical protein
MALVVPRIRGQISSSRLGFHRQALQKHECGNHIRYRPAPKAMMTAFFRPLYTQNTPAVFSPLLLKPASETVEIWYSGIL